MSALVDIVNFNADASCLDSANWLSILSGGSNSQFCKWLTLYTRHEKRMALGMTGAAVSDLVMHNPAAVTIIRDNPQIFQVVLRPYAHDIPLLRTPYGYCFNLAAGKAALTSAFGRRTNYYLPPEFMILSDQIRLLAAGDVENTFINSQRYAADFANRIPRQPYRVRGVMNSQLGCVPVNGELTQLYLRAIQLWDVEGWNKSIKTRSLLLRLWRDGESCFLIPDGIEREEYWLTHCDAERIHLGNEEYDSKSNSGLYQSYPVHSCSAWMKEFRMLGFLNRLNEIEKRLKDLAAEAKYLWLLAINSDILSAFEKESPLIKIRAKPKGSRRDFQIIRSERGYEGEEYLALLEQFIEEEPKDVHLGNAASAHLIKANGRLQHLRQLKPTCNTATLCS